jgi:16S rRNA A1518/A1519 N6-dimethyltransferase RsmA/KsgA/DIM1 with predicted DNA glycosylase/AP lyase activity
VQFVNDHGGDGASVLEIGGGVGEIQVELLRRGASNVTNPELSAQCEAVAARPLAGTVPVTRAAMIAPRRKGPVSG